jgi:hypothetical protein
MAIDLDGASDQYLTIVGEEDFDFTGAMSVSCWFTAESLTKAWQALVTKGDNAWRLQRQQIQNNIAFILSTSAGIQRAIAATNINDNVLRHVVGVYNPLLAEPIRIYIDGVEDGVSVPFAGTIDLTNSPVRIGSNVQVAGRSWDGIVDDVRIYDRALSPAEVQTIYATDGSDGIVNGLKLRTDFREASPGTVATDVKDRGPDDHAITEVNSPVYAESALRGVRRAI